MLSNIQAYQKVKQRNEFFEFSYCLKQFVSEGEVCKLSQVISK